MKNKLKLIWNLLFGKQKFIKSFIEVGDVIRVFYNGYEKIYKVEKFEVIPNHPTVTPTDFVINCKFSWNKGKNSIECTSENFKYISHIDKKYHKNY